MASLYISEGAHAYVQTNTQKYIKINVKEN